MSKVELFTGRVGFAGVCVANHLDAKGGRVIAVIRSRGRFKVKPAWL